MSDGSDPAMEPEPASHDEASSADPRSADRQPVGDPEPERERPRAAYVEGGPDRKVGVDEDGSDQDGPDPEQQSSQVAAILQEFIQAGGQVFDHLRELPSERLREIAADPLTALFDYGQQLGVEWQGTLEELVTFARSRISGAYAVDEFGFDPEFSERILMPALRWLSQRWFRVEVRGVENLPTEGAALLVSNHAGTLPLDAMVLHSVVFDQIGRHTRMLGADLVFKTPYSHDFARRIGGTVACPEDAARLLADGELVSVFPEGFKGLGKLYSERYRLQRFGRGGFVATAVRAQVPIVPVSIVGSEEIYPLLSTAPTLAKLLGFPYFPITPLFPWLGVLGMIPLPSKWIIDFGEVVTTDELEPGAADDPMMIFQLTDQIRLGIQNTLFGLLEERPNTFW